MRLNWTLKYNPKFNVSRGAHRRLQDSCKAFLVTLLTAPPKGRRCAPATLVATGSLMKVVLKWMFVEGVSSFRALDAACLERLRVSLAERRGRGREKLGEHSIRLYMDALAAFYELRDQLSDAPAVDPSPYCNERFYPRRPKDVRRIPALPDEIAVPFLAGALSYVETYSNDILRALNIVLKIDESEPRHCARRRRLYREGLARAAIVDPEGRKLSLKSEVLQAVQSLRAACVIVVGGLVGMRLSEILALRQGAVETRHDPLTGEEQTYIASRLYKTSGVTGGREERWIAPAPAVRAVHVLEQLSAPFRRMFGQNLLFLSESLKYEYSMLAGSQVNALMNAFAMRINVPLFEGARWRFSSHQLRKTFARFVGKRDRTHLQALSEHFKHVSLAMTSQAYVGTDFDLRELVDADTREDTAAALDSFLSGVPLAGKMGERIMARGALFRGRAGVQVRRDYIEFVMRETDLSLHACDYGWCVFQPEAARCRGERAPDDAIRSPAVCLSCANMVIEPKHAPYWRDRRERNADLVPVASLLARASLNEAIEQCDRVLRQLENSHGQEASPVGRRSGGGASISSSTRAPTARRGSPRKTCGPTRPNHSSVGGLRGAKKQKSTLHDPSRHPGRDRDLDAAASGDRRSRRPNRPA